MGSPIIFSGRRAKLLTPDAILKSTGAIIDYNGAIDYIPNGHAEVNTVGVVAYANTPGPIPVTGTGGTPNSTLTRSTVAPLAGTGSFVFTKSGSANRQGEGFSLNFTIDSAMQAQQLAINLLNQVATGTYVAGDMAVYVYDVTNAVIIQPSAYLVQPTTLGGPAQQLTFQAASNSVSYRLCFHVASTSALDYSLKFKNISVGPQVKTTGVPVTDWVSYTPTYTSFGTVSTSEVEWRRVGDTVYGRGYFVTGTPVAAASRISLPPGLSLNVTGKTSQTMRLGSATSAATTSISIASTGAGPFALTNDNTSPTSLAFSISTRTVANHYELANGNAIAGASYSMSFEYEAKIAGWSSNVQVSDSASTRVVAFDSLKTGGTTNGFSAVNTFTSIQKDSVGGFNLSTGIYTVQVPGDYSFVANHEYSAAQVGSLGFSVNGGAPNAYGIDASTFYKTISALIPNLKTGDTVKLVSTTGSSLSLSRLTFSGNLIQGPAQIAASEIIAARYVLSGSPNLVTGTAIVYGTRDFDTHGAYNPSTGRFTAPAPGIYQFYQSLNTAGATSASIDSAVGSQVSINGGAAGAYVVLHRSKTTAVAVKSSNGSITLNLLMGQTVDLLGYNDTTATDSLNGTSYNWLSIHRIGGV